MDSFCSLNTGIMELHSPDIGLILAGIFTLVFICLWIMALIRITKHRFRGENEKLMWLLLVIFVPLIGTILYFAFGRSGEIRK